MNILPYTNLPIANRARAYTPSWETNVARTIAEWREQHAAILVCGTGDIRDDYTLTEQTDYLERLGEFA